MGLHDAGFHDFDVDVVGGAAFHDPLRITE